MLDRGWVDAGLGIVNRGLRRFHGINIEDPAPFDGVNIEVADPPVAGTGLPWTGSGQAGQVSNPKRNHRDKQGMSNAEVWIPACAGMTNVTSPCRRRLNNRAEKTRGKRIIRGGQILRLRPPAADCALRYYSGLRSG